MKKRILSFLLATFLCSGMAVNVAAMENQAVDNSEVTLPVPNINWQESGNMNWVIQADHMEGNSDYSIHYEFSVWNGANPTETWSIGYGESHDDIWYPMASHINDSGEYKIKVRSYVMDENYNSTYSAYAETETRTYTRPSDELGTVVGHWDENRSGIFVVPVIDRASQYQCSLYMMDDYMDDFRYCGGIIFDSDPNNNPYNNPYTIYNEVSSAYEVDFTNWMTNEGQYCVTVRALSADIDTLANGCEGGKSDILNTVKTSATVGDVLNGANSYENASEGLAYLKANTAIENLKVGMQTDTAVLGQVSALEDKYAAQNGITVTPSSATGGAENYVDAGKVEIIGAALNAQAGQNMQLVFSIPENQETIDTNTYKNAVQLNLSLYCEGQSVTDLSIPVTVTMPVPVGVKTSNLRIFHYHNGIRESVNLKVNDDGTVTFTVSGFSTFVFANEEADSAQVTETVPAANPVPAADATSETASDTVLTSPKTAEENIVLYVMLLAMAVFGGTVVLGIHKMKCTK